MPGGQVNQRSLMEIFSIGPVTLVLGLANGLTDFYACRVIGEFVGGLGVFEGRGLLGMIGQYGTVALCGTLSLWVASQVASLVDKRKLSFLGLEIGF